MNSKLIVSVLLVIAVSSKITLEAGLQQTQITLTDVHSFSEVLVQAEFNYVDNDRYEKVHLVVRSINKHKKQAYMDLVRKFNGIVRALIKLKAIPNKESMIQSIIHRNFLRKSRKWQFSRYFIVYALKEQTPKLLQKLQVFKVEVVKSPPVVHYLDEKFISIAAFLEAKIELEKFIRQHLNSQFRILLTKDIQIIGDKVRNEDMIQADIQKQFNRAGETASEGASTARQIEGFYASTSEKVLAKKIVMKVLFQLVQKAVDFEDILEEIQDGDLQSHSISDFESQMHNEHWKDEDTAQLDSREGRDEDQSQNINENNDL